MHNHINALKPFMEWNKGQTLIKTEESLGHAGQNKVMNGEMH